jgi:hypothetical protein
MAIAILISAVACARPGQYMHRARTVANIGQTASTDVCGPKGCGALWGPLTADGGLKSRYHTTALKSVLNNKNFTNIRNAH